MGRTFEAAFVSCRTEVAGFHLEAVRRLREVAFAQAATTREDGHGILVVLDRRIPEQAFRETLAPVLSGLGFVTGVRPLGEHPTDFTLALDLHKALAWHEAQMPATAGAPLDEMGLDIAAEELVRWGRAHRFLRSAIAAAGSRGDAAA